LTKLKLVYVILFCFWEKFELDRRLSIGALCKNWILYYCQLYLKAWTYEFFKLKLKLKLKTKKCSYDIQTFFRRVQISFRNQNQTTLTYFNFIKTISKLSKMSHFILLSSYWQVHECTRMVPKLNFTHSLH